MTELQIEATKALEYLDNYLKNRPLWMKGFELALNVVPFGIGTAIVHGERKRLTDYRMELLETIAGRRDALPRWPGEFDV